ncbi:GTP-binding protein EngB [Acrasis kona]|uniref:GTP-binding protein EngB n=1 Tax=Acrasis kona TaxID=1008807 RepID=A0AAW2YL25_9EUKA
MLDDESLKVNRQNTQNKILLPQQKRPKKTAANYFVQKLDQKPRSEKSILEQQKNMQKNLMDHGFIPKKQKKEHGPLDPNQVKLVNYLGKPLHKPTFSTPRPVKGEVPTLDSSAAEKVRTVFERYNEFEFRSLEALEMESKPLLNFRRHTFLRSFDNINHLPNPILPEVAIIGRSNVGKSSLVNRLLNSRKLVRVSSTPGRTQTLNYFSVSDAFHIVDMPGYGYAKAPLNMVRQWHKLVQDYIFCRTYPNVKIEEFEYYKEKPYGPLKMVYWLLDCRRDSIKQTDRRFFEFLLKKRINFCVVLTKMDKIKSAETERIVALIVNQLYELGKKITKVPQFDVLRTSSLNDTGVNVLKYKIMSDVGYLSLVMGGDDEMQLKLTPLYLSNEDLQKSKELAATYRTSATKKGEIVRTKLEQDIRMGQKREDLGLVEEVEDESPVVRKSYKKDKKPIKKVKQRIGLLAQDNPYVHRTHFLDDKVNRTSSQYKSYRKVHMFNTKKGRNMTRKKRKGKRK